MESLVKRLKKKSILSKLFKDFLEVILNGKINDNKIENYIKKKSIILKKI